MFVQVLDVYISNFQKRLDFYRPCHAYQGMSISTIPANPRISDGGGCYMYKHTCMDYIYQIWVLLCHAFLNGEISECQRVYTDALQSTMRNRVLSSRPCLYFSPPWERNMGPPIQNWSQMKLIVQYFLHEQWSEVKQNNTAEMPSLLKWSFAGPWQDNQMQWVTQFVRGTISAIDQPCSQYEYEMPLWAP